MYILSPKRLWVVMTLIVKIAVKCNLYTFAESKDPLFNRSC